MPWQSLAFLREEGVARSVTEGVVIPRSPRLRGNLSRFNPPLLDYHVAFAPHNDESGCFAKKYKLIS